MREVTGEKTFLIHQPTGAPTSFADCKLVNIGDERSFNRYGGPRSVGPLGAAVRSVLGGIGGSRSSRFGWLGRVMDHDSCRALFAEKFLKMLSQEIAHRVRIIGLPRSPSDGAVWTVECLAGGSELSVSRAAIVP